MKFMIKELGWARWRDEYDRELTACRLRGDVPTLDLEPPATESRPEWPKDVPPTVGDIAGRVADGVVTGPGIMPIVVPLLSAGDDAYVRWRSTNVRPQKQFGYVVAAVTVPLGDLTAPQLRVLGDLSRAYGDGTVRVTVDQNLLFRWVATCDARQLYRRLAAAGLGRAEAGTIADVCSCPGAESCRLAVTQSRGLGRLLEDRLRARPDVIAAANGARIKISGCPNGCGQHHLAAIGFQGSVRRIGGRAVPQYFVMVGGDVTDRGASFARLVAKVPVRRIPDAVERLVGIYAREREEGEGAGAFFARVDLDRLKVELADLERFTAADAVSDDFVDLGESQEFAPVVMDGECSA
jgi:sulfite reductase (NADPH) hemoprotein beta-component